jgi:hypothetical protein
VGKIKTSFILITCLFCLKSGYCQTLNNPSPLREVFQEIENHFPYIFSFKTNIVENHLLDFNRNRTIEENLLQLTNKTLFDFGILPDKTIVVTLKKKVVSRCLKLQFTGEESGVVNTYIQTPFQQLITTREAEVSLLFIDEKSSLKIISKAFNPVIKNASQLNKKTCSTVSVVKKITALPAIQLQSYLAKGISKNSYGTVTVDYENFDLLPGLIETDVLQTIKALPGIQSVNETVSYLNIRGGTNDQNLLLWDGIKMYQSGHFFGLISAFNPYITKSVDVIKNGSDASYGDGVSGIVSMKGSDDIAKKTSGGIGLNLLSTDGYVKVPITTKSSIELSARRSVDSDLRTPTYDQYFDKAFQNTEVTTASENTSASDDDFSFYDINFRFLYEISPKDFLRFNFIQLGNRLDFIENATVDNALLSRESTLDQNNSSAGLFYRRDWNKNWQTKVQAYGSIYSIDAVNFDVLNEQRLAQENKVEEAGIKVSATHFINNAISTSFGYQLNETGITNFEQLNFPFFQRRDKQVLVTNSVFGTFTYSNKEEKLNINAGLRANHISKFNDVLIEPRLSIKKGVFENISIDILGEIKSQTTSQSIDFQNDFLGVENRRWILSNPDETPIIKSKQVSTGITFNNDGWLVNAEGYYKEVTGITSQSQGFQNQFIDARTTGRYTVRGIEFLVNKRFTKINTWLSYTLADNAYTFEELSPNRFHNNIDVRHTLTYGINYVLNAFKISAGFNWHSGKPTTLINESEPIVNNTLNFQSPNAANIDDYFRVDLSATYDFSLYKNVRGMLGVSFWNLLDNDNIVNHFYRINQSDTLEEVEENALRFTPNFSIRLYF